MQMNIMQPWSSSFSGLSETALCPVVSGHDENTTVTASQVIAASGTGLLYFILLLLSFLGVCFKPLVKLSSSQGMCFVFLIGALVSFVNVFTNSDNLQVKLYFRISIVAAIGIFTLFGAVLFFSQPGEETNEPTLGRQQPSMGLVVGAITFPLIVIEIVLIISTQASKNAYKPSEETYKLWTFVIVDKSMFLAQKFIQAVMYLYLRNKITCVDYKENAQFYFRILSFFNLIEWVDSQVNADSDVQLSGAEQKLDGWFDVFADLYKALIIDYRLLCCLLFLEHSLEIRTEEEDENFDVERDDAVSELEGPVTSYVPPQGRQQRSIGYISGCLCLIAPVVCGLYYVHSLQIGAWVHVFALMVNLVIVSSGTCLLTKNDLEEGENKESSGVKIMVCCLGAVGFTCWMVEAAIAGYWAATSHDRSDIIDKPNVVWNAATFTVRGLTTAFLMGLFMKVNARALPIQNPNRTINHVLVPIVMLGILSAFCESLIDQYFGPLDKRIRFEIKEQSLQILLEVGPPMYLGFLIHVCLHFVIIETKIGKRALPDTDSESDYTTARSSTISEYLEADGDIV